MIRTLLVVAAVIVFVLAVLGMRAGWRNRARRQSMLPALAARPAVVGALLAPELTGLYVGTTFAECWQDRVVAHGLGIRAASSARLTAEGVDIDRDGADPVFIPAQFIDGAGLGSGLAGKVLGEGGLLLIRWRLGEHLLDSGLRADDRAGYPDWVRAIDELTAQGARS
ncbi:MAG: transporter [Jatrophihabitans sp.]